MGERESVGEGGRGRRRPNPDLSDACVCVHEYVSMLCLHMRIETEITAHNHES